MTSQLGTPRVSCVMTYFTNMLHIKHSDSVNGPACTVCYSQQTGSGKLLTLYGGQVCIMCTDLKHTDLPSRAPGSQEGWQRHTLELPCCDSCHLSFWAWSCYLSQSASCYHHAAAVQELPGLKKLKHWQSAAVKVEMHLQQLHTCEHSHSQ